jgi:hypothetical protein
MIKLFFNNINLLFAAILSIIWFFIAINIFCLTFVKNHIEKYIKFLIDKYESNKNKLSNK